MIRFYYHPTPNPAKVALFLEETGLPYEVIPVDTSKGQQHTAEFRTINPNGKVPAIVDTDGPGHAEVRVFDSTAILLYLAEKTGQLLGSPADRGQLLSWLLYIATGLGPFSGQAVHFQRAAPEKLPYAINRYRREAERHYAVLDSHRTRNHPVVAAVIRNRRDRAASSQNFHTIEHRSTDTRFRNFGENVGTKKT